MKIYRTNIEKHKTAILNLDSVIKRLSVLRLVSFLTSLIIIGILANERLTILIWIVAPLCVVLFAILLNRYNHFTNLRKTSAFLKEINENELLRLENKLSSFSTGQSYISIDHAYVEDLDIFGTHSLFQLLNRTTTESSEVCLAKWLSETATKEVILERQQAIKELSPKLEWRQQFQAAGMFFKNVDGDYKKLMKWFENGEQKLSNHTKYLIGSIVLSILSTSFAILYTINSIPEGWNIYLLPLILVLFINYRILKKVAPLAEEIIDHTHRNVETLSGYQILIKTILSEKFHSKKLQALQSKLKQSEYSAAIEINRLKKILEVFQLRGTKRSDSNKFYVVFNYFWLFDIYWLILSEKWKHKNRNNLKPWISAISEFEVLSSLAGFSHANPHFSFPEIKEAPYRIHFEKLGHPLIDSEKMVCNDFNLGRKGEITMITGSNMAGKSTFLRTVGVNLILALAGAPCCAKSGQVSSMKIFTSMRTQDNLEEGVSSFYAELKRIERLLNLIQNGEAVFFLLDEMFKGTNSEDRYKGGVSLIKQLSQLNAFGIVSTHDLELAKLAENHMIVSNYSFNSEIQKSEMTFNYKLMEGTCRDFNASELMKRSGIKILPNVAKM